MNVFGSFSIGIFRQSLKFNFFFSFDKPLLITQLSSHDECESAILQWQVWTCSLSTSIHQSQLHTSGKDGTLPSPWSDQTSWSPGKLLWFNGQYFIESKEYVEMSVKVWWLSLFNLKFKNLQLYISSPFLSFHSILSTISKS
jgi:hypothetical protein